ncbi:Uncharacterised protein [uncultured archaeon]|nr:Uncharacterised protein [uncultured archaeon]
MCQYITIAKVMKLEIGNDASTGLAKPEGDDHGAS